METLSDERQVTAGVLHGALGAITTHEAWRGRPTTDLMLRLLDVLGPGDGDLVPAVVGECLVPLRFDPDRQRVLLDMIRGFDLRESWPGLVLLLGRSPSWHAVLVAAALATNPTVPLAVSRAIEEALQVLPPDERMARELEIIREGVLPPGAGKLEAAVLAERWPGRVDQGETQVPSPVVVIADDAGPMHSTLRLAADLRRHGVQVRRIAGTTKRLPRGWVPRWALVVAGTDEIGLTGVKQIVATGGSLSPSTHRDVLRRLNKMYGGRLGLPVVRESAGPVLGSDPLDDVEAFLQGALIIQEATLLTGWSAQTIRKRSSRYEALRPRYVANTPYFTFAQLTALRVEKYLSTSLRKRVSQELAARIVRDTQRQERVPTHVTADGRVLFEEGGGLVDEDGQMAFPPVAMDEVIRSFELGGGQTAPELLKPSLHTRVHPLIGHGSPTVEETRIPATVVRDVMRWGRDAGKSGSDLIAYAQNFYDLTPEQIHDAEDLGMKIAA